MTENLAAPSGTFQLGGDLPVVRLGYGTMQLPGEGCGGRRATTTRRCGCCGARSRSA